MRRRPARRRRMRAPWFGLSLVAVLTAGAIAAGTSVADERPSAEKPAAENPTAETPTPERVAPVVLQMMRNEVIHDHLRLDATARQLVFAALDEIDGPWWRSRLLPEAQRVQTVSGLSEQLDQRLAQILTAAQRSRLRQLEQQALLKAEDKQELEKLTPRQIRQRFGEPLDFSGVTRIFPRGPELIGSEDAWLQGDATTLLALRGKVVAVHFYAFGCINCKRNLPHYQAWHEDLAAQGLVVIGIQTPETNRERDPAEVVRAATADGIGYRVLMDGQSLNWKAWGNTMWPTVYLIDKQGYIRHWWQGELNWQGQSGEQTLRNHLNSLLAE